MEPICEVEDRNGRSTVTFTLTMPLQAHAADLVAVLRQERAQKKRLGHNAAVEAINNLLSLAKSRFDL